MRRTLETARAGLGWLIDRGVPVEVRAEWQENSDKPCDVGTPVAELEPSFPDFSFAAVDPVYPSKSGRYAFSEAAIVRRGADCRAWLRARSERVIAVVSHSGFLRVGVSNCGFGNADYRIFDFATGVDDDRLIEWPVTQEGGGGLGRSMKGYFGVESQPWPQPVSAEAPADQVQTPDEVIPEKPTDEAIEQDGNASS